MCRLASLTQVTSDERGFCTVCNMLCLLPTDPHHPPTARCNATTVITPVQEHHLLHPSQVRHFLYLQLWLHFLAAPSATTITGKATSPATMVHRSSSPICNTPHRHGSYIVEMDCSLIDRNVFRSKLPIVNQSNLFSGS